MWEYDVYVDDVRVGDAKAVVASIKGIEANVKKYGQEGWELVAVESVPTGDPKVIAMVHYFKKQ